MATPIEHMSDEGHLQRAAKDGRCAASIRDADREINAFVEVFDGADATQTEAGPLSDLTFAVKEIIEQKGRASPWGVGFLQDRIGAETAPCVLQIEEAGACRVGTTRSTLMAIVGESGTRNPRNLKRSPGGSSAGSAAAVASGMVDFALGTQTVGSVIRPASYCGVVGFKPTFGKIPLEGVMPLANDLDHVGFLAQEVSVVRTIMGALTSLDPPGDAVSHIMVPNIWFEAVIHPGVKAAVDRAKRTFEKHGLEVMPFEVPQDIAKDEGAVLEGLLCKGIHDNHSDFIRTHAACLPGELVELEARGAMLTTKEHAALRARRDEMRHHLSEGVPTGAALLCPSVMDLPPLLGQGTGARQPQRLWTLLGWPALGIPAGTYGGSSDDLPVSVQLVGRGGADAALLDLGLTLEDNMEEHIPLQNS